MNQCSNFLYFLSIFRSFHGCAELVHADPLLDDEEEEDQEIKDALKKSGSHPDPFIPPAPACFDHVSQFEAGTMNHPPPRPGGANAELPPPPRPPKKASLQVIAFSSFSFFSKLRVRGLDLSHCCFFVQKYFLYSRAHYLRRFPPSLNPGVASPFSNLGESPPYPFPCLPRVKATPRPHRLRHFQPETQF